MKRIYMIYLVLLTAAMIVLSSSIYAFMYKETPVQTNDFTNAIVDCEVNEMRTDNTKTSIAVRNTGNVDAYIRVRLVSYWVDEAKNIVAKASETPKLSSSNIDTYDWIADVDNDVYYYKHPVAPNANTENLLEKTQITLVTEDGYKQVVEVFAEAIQAVPKKAVENSWNVTVENGIITTVK